MSRYRDTRLGEFINITMITIVCTNGTESNYKKNPDRYNTIAAELNHIG